MNNKGFPWRCVHCGKSFRYKNSYVKHKNIHTGVKPYKCTFCPTKFADPSARRKHEDNHLRPGRNHHCKECGRSFSSYSSLRRHTRNAHSSEKPFRCRYCPAAFVSSGISKKHEARHLRGQLVHKCKKCGVMFSTRTLLTKHMQVHMPKKKHNTIPRMLQCNWCNTSFTTSVGLSNHVRSHRDQLRMFQCNWCNTSFTTSVGLSNHVRSHRDQPRNQGFLSVASFKCEHCGKCFHNKRSLGIHRWQVHHGQRLPYLAPKAEQTGVRCEQCDKMLPSFASLKNHKGAVHYVPEVYCCPVCRKMFLKGLGLLKHLSCHPGQMFRCERCSKSFASAERILAHAKRFPGHDTGSAFKTAIDPNVLPNVSYVCGQCGKSVPTYRSLTMHKAGAHERHASSVGDTVIVSDSGTCSAIEGKRASHRNSKEPGERKLCSVKIQLRALSYKKLYKCNGCQKRFATYFALRTHKGLNASVGVTARPCPAQGLNSGRRVPRFFQKTKSSRDERRDLSSDGPTGTVMESSGKKRSAVEPPRGSVAKKARTSSAVTKGSSGVDTLASRQVKAKGSYKCSECNKEFASKKCLRTHGRQIHNIWVRPKRMEVALRERTFKRLSGKSRAVTEGLSDVDTLDSRQVEAKGCHKCSECNKEFASKRCLRTHGRQIHNIWVRPKRMEVALRERTFKRLSGKSRAVTEGLSDVDTLDSRQVEAKGCHKCSECNKEFASKRCLRTHGRQIHNIWVRPKMMEVALRERTVKRLSRKSRAVTEGLPDANRCHKCCECNKEFAMKKYLRTHMRKIHNIWVKPKKMDVALRERTAKRPSGTARAIAKSLSNVDALASRQVEANGCHKCSECNKEFAKKKYRRKHMRMIHNIWVKPTKMEAAVKKRTVKKPSRTSGAVTKGSSDVDTLASRQVEAKGCHKCSECNKEFAMKKYLRTHMRKIHNIWVKPKKMDVALRERTAKRPSGTARAIAKSLSNVDALASRQVEANGCHKCSECNKEFAKKKYRRKHMRMIHNIWVKPTKMEAAVKKRTVKKPSRTSGAVTKGSSDVDTLASRQVEAKGCHKCSECNKEFAKKRNLRTHLRKIHNIWAKPKKMDVAVKKRTVKRPSGTSRPVTKDSLSVDTLASRQVKAKGSYKCSECNKEFASKRCLRTHGRQIHNIWIRPKKMEVALRERTVKRLPGKSRAVTKGSSSVDTLASRQVKAKGSHKCSVCNKDFAKDYLRTHERTIHNIWVKPREVEVAEGERTAQPAGGHENQPEPLSNANEAQRPTRQNLKKAEPLKSSQQQKHKCNGAYSSATSLAKHRFRAIRARRSTAHAHPCDICGGMFPSLNAMKLHRTAKHLTRKCSVCSKTFSTLEELHRHLERHPRKHFVGEICYKEHASPAALRRAPLRHYRDTSTAAASIDGTNTSATAVEQKRPQAGDGLGTTNSPARHKRAQGSQAEPEVGAESASPGRQRNVGVVRLGDQKERSYACSMCGREFSSYVNFYSHLPLHADQDPGETSDGPANESNRCTLCRKSFHTSSILREHIDAAHSNNRKCVCQVCGKAFEGQYLLERHMVVHSDARPFACTLCTGTFKRPDHLKVHVLGEHPGR